MRYGIKLFGLFFSYVHGKLTLKRGVYMLDLFVLDAVSGEKVSAVIRPATESDFLSTQNWQTNWRSSFAAELPNKVALSCAETDELLGLMSMIWISMGWRWRSSM